MDLRRRVIPDCGGWCPTLRGGRGRDPVRRHGVPGEGTALAVRPSPATYAAQVEAGATREETVLVYKDVQSNDLDKCSSTSTVPDRF